MKYVYLFIFLLLSCSLGYSQNPCQGIPTVDYGGQIYHTVQIGSQCWLKENLNVGTMIQGIDTAKNNSIIEKYCYNNDPANCTAYGGFYHWNEAIQYVTTQKAKGICPTDWHIPAYTEFTTLLTSAGGDGNKLKAIGQGSGGGAGTNTSGFSAFMAGYRLKNGSFDNLGYFTSFWSSTEIPALNATYMRVIGNISSVDFPYFDKGIGYNVRCLYDIPTGINDHSNNSLPESIDLLQNYPNPFNPSTTISFTLPGRTNLTLSIYNQLGEKVAVLFNGEEEAGVHNIEWNAGKFVSGIYFYELKTEKFTSVKKLILMK